MSNEFKVSATVEAKNLMREEMPERMTLNDLRVLKKRAEVILGELWKLAGKQGHISAPERANITLRRHEMDMFLARVNDLIQAALSVAAFVQSIDDGEECQNHPANFKL